MGKIKVLRIIARLNIGGPARHVTLLTGGMDTDRFDSTLMYGQIEDGEGDMSYLAAARGIKQVVVPELGRSINLFSDISAFFKILAVLRRERPHIVHTHTAKAGTLGRLAALVAGVPVKVHTYHGHVFYGYFNSLATFFFLWVERILALFTDRIVAISATQKEELLNKYRIGNDRKYAIVKIGLDLKEFLNTDDVRGVFRARYGFDKDAVLVGVVGRLVPIKNHTMFIDAASRLKESLGRDEFCRVRFVIIGDGPEKVRLSEYAASKGLAGSVVFTGWEHDLKEVYADLDIVALTSKNEGTPVSLIEAFAAGRPVVATDVGGVADVLGDCGILTEKDDTASFASALARLIRSAEERARMGDKGRSLVLNEFSKEKLLKNMEKLYEDLLTEKGIMA